MENKTISGKLIATLHFDQIQVTCPIQAIFASVGHSFTTLWKLKLAEIGKYTSNVLTLAISVEYVMSACAHTHVLQDTTQNVTTCWTIHQKMTLQGLRMGIVDQGLALVGHDKDDPDEAAQ